MNLAKIILSAIILSSAFATLTALKATRSLNLFYTVDAANPITSLRICTRATLVSYTTDQQVALPNAPVIIQTTYYTTPIRTRPCPTTTIYSAE
ncbi:hypothetical protein SAMN05428949_4829 [Chitinophaga sp. YR627]|nr:hypothetical protein SAMN05428949_4829 [Chitinophaga sp. YR627]